MRAEDDKRRLFDSSDKWLPPRESPASRFLILLSIAKSKSIQWVAITSSETVVILK